MPDYGPLLVELFASENASNVRLKDICCFSTDCVQHLYLSDKLQCWKDIVPV